MLNDFLSVWNDLHFITQLILGIIALTWIPVGLATGGLLFAMDIRRFPAQTLEHYYY